MGARPATSDPAVFALASRLGLDVEHSPQAPSRLDAFITQACEWYDLHRDRASAQHVCPARDGEWCRAMLTTWVGRELPRAPLAVQVTWVADVLLADARLTSHEDDAPQLFVLENDVDALLLVRPARVREPFPEGGGKTSWLPASLCSKAAIEGPGEEGIALVIPRRPWWRFWK